MRLIRALVIGMVAAVVLAPAAMSEQSAASRATLAAHSSRYGTVLFDGRGFVLYAFTADRHGRSACYGPCAGAWPPYIVRRAPSAGLGAARPLIGTTKRRDGSLQATYAGRPLYFYVGDRKPHQILCQNASEFGGLWLVLRPSGRLVR